MHALLLSGSSIIGTDVKNAQGENLGSIKEVMIDVHSNRVGYLVVSFGGFLGIGDKYFAVPLEAFTIDTEEHIFILPVDKERLENAPGFDKDEWPSTANSTFMNEVYNYYGKAYYNPA